MKVTDLGFIVLKYQKARWLDGAQDFLIVAQTTSHILHMMYFLFWQMLGLPSTYIDI